jgi:hypothetical protein
MRISRMLSLVGAMLASCLMFTGSAVADSPPLFELDAMQVVMDGKATPATAHVARDVLIVSDGLTQQCKSCHSQDVSAQGVALPSGNNSPMLTLLAIARETDKSTANIKVCKTCHSKSKGASEVAFHRPWGMASS